MRLPAISKRRKAGGLMYDAIVRATRMWTRNRPPLDIYHEPHRLRCGSRKPSQLSKQAQRESWEGFRAMSPWGPTRDSDGPRIYFPKIAQPRAPSQSRALPQQTSQGSGTNPQKEAANGLPYSKRKKKKSENRVPTIKHFCAGMRKHVLRAMTNLVALPLEAY